jgi:hypothetical protein
MVEDSTNILRFQNRFLKDSGLQIPTENIFTNTLKGRIGILDYNSPYLKATAHLGQGGSDPELYYLTSLLADLCASHLAYQIDHPRHCSQETPTAPVTKEEFNHLWRPANNEIVNFSSPVYTETIEQRRAETVPTRRICWFEGVMGGGEPVQFESSVRAIV